MLSGKNRVAAREALEVKVEHATFEWLQATYEEMCNDRREDPDPDIMQDADRLKQEWAIKEKHTQYVTYPCW
jgi:hypothetical protein